MLITLIFNSDIKDDYYSTLILTSGKEYIEIELEGFYFTFNDKELKLDNSDDFINSYKIYKQINTTTFLISSCDAFHLFYNLVNSQYSFYDHNIPDDIHIYTEADLLNYLQIPYEDKLVKVGDKYKHYKSGDIYEIVPLPLDSETGKEINPYLTGTLVVAYQNIINKKVWYRTLFEFVEIINNDFPRFEKIK